MLWEEAFKEIEVASWHQQKAFLSMATSFILSIVFTFIVCKLNLTTGVIPSLNVAAGLLGFTIIKFWMTLLAQTGFLKHHFIQQENTVIQTCVVALYGIAFSSGTASYILSMSPRVAAEAEGGNTPNNVKNLSLVWMICFHFLVSFVGLFSIIALRQVSQCIMLVTRHTTEIQVYLGSSYLHCLGLATFYEFGKHEYLNSFWINLNFIYLFWLIVTILCYMSKYN